MNMKFSSLLAVPHTNNTILVLLLIFALIPFAKLSAQEINETYITSKWGEYKKYDTQEKTQDSLFSLAKRISKMQPKIALANYKFLDSLIEEPLFKLQFYREWSIVEFRQGNNQTTKQLRKKALDIAYAEAYPYEQISYANSLATYYINLSIADSASFYAKQIESIVAKHPDKVGKHLWLAYTRNSSIEGILGNTEKQGEFLERAYEEKLKYPRDSNLGFALYNVADFYRQLDDPVKSSKYTEQLILHYEKRKINTPDAHFPVENLLLAVNTPEAIQSLKKVIIASDSLRNYNAMSASTLTLTRAYFENNEPQKAIPFLKHTIAVLAEANYPVNHSAEIYLLQEAYAQSNDFENAYHSVLKQQKMEDSLRSAQTLDNIANYEVKYKTAETQLELEKKNAAQKFLYAIIISAAVLIALIGYFFFQNKKKNALLSSQKDELQTALSEKEMLLKEIHHRVKNNLQVISSLLSLQQRQIDDPTASKAFQIGRDRVKAMSLIHQNLYQEGNLIGVSISDYVDKLAKSLIANYRVENKNIKLDVDVAPLNLDVDTIIPIGLIINELISNTLKYAFTERNEGTISISLKQKEKTLFLSVKDDGIGLPSTFKVEETTSLGYRLIKAFSEKLKAALTINSNTLGTEVSLQIPYSK